MLNLHEYRMAISTRTSLVMCLTALLTLVGTAQADNASTPKQVAAFIDEHCWDCHNPNEITAELDLETIAEQPFASNIARWENVVRKLRSRQMPPIDMPAPSENDYHKIITSLTNRLDAIAAKHPRPGRTDTMRRLTRTEYSNAVRDLLHLDIDVGDLLPADELSHGFDNITVSNLSPTLMNRYISAAQKISRLAVGRSIRSPEGATFRVKADVTQHEHVVGLPLGTRGGMLIKHTFQQDGEYEIVMRLTRDRNDEVEGLYGTHQVELLLDRHHIQSFKVRPPADKNYSLVDAHLKARIKVTAGPHNVGVAFVKNPSSIIETRRQPYQARFNYHRHRRLSPALFQVSINGPFTSDGPGDTPSRRRIFTRQPASDAEIEPAARDLLGSLMRRAYRRPVHESDFDKPMRFFRQASKSGGFEAGIELALTSILISPQFLFRIERDPAGVASGTPYRLSDLELASRLSFFLWSSIPDDELLDLATENKLRDASVLESQVRRMLNDPRASNLSTNFAGQWLYLRNLASARPEMRAFPDFDDNLRQAFRQETEMFFQSIMREDRSVVDLIKSDYTFLNERLAKHYGIPHIYGSRFRRVAVTPESKRGGLLRHGSILTVTSYATRTSPVVRGNWILENIIGSPPPPPPANVPALKEKTILSTLSVRERLMEHRKNPACSGCHDLIDPIGFALENFDAVGRWRHIEEGKPIDSSGGFGSNQFTGLDGLEQELLNRPDLFVGTFTAKLLTYALGRGVEHHDMPAIRKIVTESQPEHYRFSSIIIGIVKSVPFQSRTAD